MIFTHTKKKTFLWDSEAKQSSRVLYYQAGEMVW